MVDVAVVDFDGALTSNGSVNSYETAILLLAQPTSEVLPGEVAHHLQLARVATSTSPPPSPSTSMRSSHAVPSHLSCCIGAMRADPRAHFCPVTRRRSSQTANTYLSCIHVRTPFQCVRKLLPHIRAVLDGDRFDEIYGYTCRRKIVCGARDAADASFRTFFETVRRKDLEKVESEQRGEYRSNSLARRTHVLSTYRTIRLATFSSLLDQTTGQPFWVRPALQVSADFSGPAGLAPIVRNKNRGEPSAC